MSGEPDFNPAIGRDPIRQLMANTRAGKLSAIEYDKRDGQPPQWRIIEPQRIVEGAESLLIRCLQLEPSQGPRHFNVDHIVSVEALDEPLRGEENHFGEAVEESDPPPESDAPPDTNALPDDDEQESIVVGFAAGRAASDEGFIEYLDAVRDAVNDLLIEAWEQDRLYTIIVRHDLPFAAVRAAHGRIYAEYLQACADDGIIDDAEQKHLQEIAKCLEQLGWKPG